MGSDKALLEWGGSSLLERACASIEPWVQTLYLATGSEPRYAQLGYECVLDPAPGLGPLGGLLAGLRRMETPWLLLLACDMPAIGTSTLRRLFAAVEATDQVVQFGSLELPEPMCALYHRSLVNHVEQSLSRAERRMVDFLSAPTPQPVVVRWIPNETRGAAPFSELINVNLPSDWLRWQEHQGGKP